MHWPAESPQRYSVLLVDDTAAERQLYQMMLEAEFDISTASRGVEGIAVAVKQHPDAIVLDVMMPGMDGWETCTQIKCLPYTVDIPVILLTAADDRDLTQHAMAVGATALLQKPCTPDQLRHTILKAVGEARDPRRI